MKLALNQAKIVLGNTKENPAVGCVIVRNNQVISAGFTSIDGRPHAEQNAIRLLKKNTNNTSLYVTLEPCSHYGKTPPCTKSIATSGIKKVFYSINDPDFRSNNKSYSFFKKKNVLVKKGVIANQINLFYESYVKSKSSYLPFVTCKLALSKDFFTINKKGRWITNQFSRGRVHLLRSNHDCIVTSSKTVLKDNPLLTCRIKGLENRSPTRIILDNNLKIPINSNIFKESSKYRTIVFYNKANNKRIKVLKKLRVELFRIPLNLNGNLDLTQCLIKAKELGFYRIFLECGFVLASNFLRQNLVDELKIFISCKSLGKNGKNNAKRQLEQFLKNNKGVTSRVNLFGDKLITYKVK